MPIAADLRQVRVKFSGNGSGMEAWFFSVMPAPSLVVFSRPMLDRGGHQP
jgi:hypothetical protein